MKDRSGSPVVLPESNGEVAYRRSAVKSEGVSALGVGLFSLDIPKDSMLRYETALTRVKETLSRTKPEALDRHK